MLIMLHFTIIIMMMMMMIVMIIIKVHNKIVKFDDKNKIILMENEIDYYLLAVSLNCYFQTYFNICTLP